MTSNNRLVIDNGDEDILIHFPEQWEWKPQPDITAYELALALSVLLYVGWDAGQWVRDLPENARRHFEKIRVE